VRVAVLLEEDGTVALQDSGGHSYGADLSSPGDAARVAIAPRGDRIATVSPAESSVQVFDLTRNPPVPITAPLGVAGVPRGVALLGDRVLIASDGGLCVVRVQEAPIVEACLAGGYGAVAIDRSGSQAVAVGASQLLHLDVESVPPAVVETVPLGGEGGTPVAVALGEEAVLAVSAEGVLTAVELPGGTARSTDAGRRIGAGAAVLPLPDGQFLVAGRDGLAVVALRDGAPRIERDFDVDGEVVDLAEREDGEVFAGLRDGWGRLDVDAGALDRIGSGVRDAVAFRIQP
jgi:hypothetical protein